MITLHYGTLITGEGVIEIPLQAGLHNKYKLNNAELAMIHDEVQKSLAKLLSKKFVEINFKVTSVVVLNLDEEVS